MQYPDTEGVIWVNPDTRKVIVPSNLLNIAVAGDIDSETVHIRIPKTFDNIDFLDKDDNEDSNINSRENTLDVTKENGKVILKIAILKFLIVAMNIQSINQL